MIRVGILGATGYTALELIKLLLRHPEVQITTLTSRQPGRPHVASVHSQLAQRLDLHLEDIGPAEVAAKADCVFSCLPHGASASSVKALLEAGARVVDFSADYRLEDPHTYAQWYGEQHVDPERLGRVVYGLPELFGEAIVEAQLVANPGCYPTAAILALAPLLREAMVEPDDLILDCKSGVTGAGRSPKLMTHFPECNESIMAYSVGSHRHTPEIEQVLGRASGRPVQVIFTPHLVPMDRGILTTAYARPARALDQQQVLETLRTFYAGQPFVRIVDHLPATKDTAHTNFCDITARMAGNRLLLICSLDNLIKGASGAAVQNFNWMYRFPETMAL